MKLIDPLEVIEFHNLLARSTLILTDSGGIQEEAPLSGKAGDCPAGHHRASRGHCRRHPEAGRHRRETIYSLVKELLTDQAEYARMSQASNPYGDGLASRRIADAIIAWKRGRA